VCVCMLYSCRPTVKIEPLFMLRNFCYFVCSVSWLFFLLDCQYQLPVQVIDWKDVSEMTCNVLMATLNPTYSSIQNFNSLNFQR